MVNNVQWHVDNLKISHIEKDIEENKLKKINEILEKKDNSRPNVERIPRHYD